MGRAAQLVALGMALACVGLLIAALTVAPVHGHDHLHPELNRWYEGLKPGSGIPCCDGSEATRLEDADWESRNGHYRVRIEDEWVDVPESAVVDEPNRDGRTLVWPYHQDGHPRVRCFMPGAMI